MSGLTFEQIRIPAALILILAVAFIFLPRAGDDATLANATPTPTIVVGQPGGAVTTTASPQPTATATAVPTATPSPTPTPVVADTFDADVLACRSISGSECDDQLGTLPTRAGSFTALVLFSDAAAGDTIHVVLTGPGGTVSGGPYTLGGGGDGYYYSTFTMSGMPRGDYLVTAYRNGEAVADTTFRRGR